MHEARAKKIKHVGAPSPEIKVALREVLMG